LPCFYACPKPQNETNKVTLRRQNKSSVLAFFPALKSLTVICRLVPVERFQVRARERSPIGNHRLQLHPERDNAIDGINTQRSEEVPVRFGAGWIGEDA
jgi:hypothetical protein